MIRVIGLMTGNSLDAVDAVLTEFGPDGSMRDLAFSSLKSPADLVAKLRELRLILEKLDGQVELAEKAYNEKCGEGAAEKLHDEYLHFLCQAVNEIKLLVPGLKIDLIGMHGQTLAHAPRSMGLTNPYTVQLGSGQGLADLTGIHVIADFRSDDLFAGGEGAPLAPMHHLHLSKQLKAQGLFPVAFCNAGNSGNLSIVSTENYLGAWDTGPFNHYPDRLMQQDRGLLCDRDGLEGRQGQVNLEFLGQLFSESTRTKTGKNFFELPPPKSADPKWYKDISSHLNFADRLRTAEYFSSYLMAYSLRWIPDQHALPKVFVLSGGGWNNPLCLGDFKKLLTTGDEALILAQHLELFRGIRSRLQSPNVLISDDLGISSSAMEARIFADAAYCKSQGIPFTTPAITGVKKATVCGLRFEPRAKPSPSAIQERWSRASRLKQ